LCLGQKLHTLVMSISTTPKKRFRSSRGTRIREVEDDIAENGHLERWFADNQDRIGVCTYMSLAKTS